jgi:cytoskeletal protein CcmA (bactofilin family)
MFSRNKRPLPERIEPPPAKPAAPSVLSRDLKIIGDLASDGEIHLDGTVDGDMRTKMLLVGETAEIKGEINADSVTVHGRISGQIKARSVHLARTAHVVGDILHEDLSIETGAFLEGHCKRIVPAKDSAPGKINVLAREADAGAAQPAKPESPGPKGLSMPAPGPLVKTGAA